MTRPNTRSQSKSAVASKDTDNEADQRPKKTITKNESSKAKVAESSNSVLEVGSAVPDHKLLNSDGEEVSILDLCKDSAIVVFMYPKANTPGCTKQACGFRDESEKFSSLGYQIFGLSADSPAALAKWKEKYNLSYQLLSDQSRSLIKDFGALKLPNSTRRSHVIIDKGGVIKAIELDVSPLESIEKALAFVDKE